MSVTWKRILIPRHCEKSVGLPRSPVQEIDNVTICGLQERRNETVKACRVKIIGWRDFSKRSMKQWRPEKRNDAASMRLRVNAASSSTHADTLASAIAVKSQITVSHVTRLNVESHVAAVSINFRRLDVKRDHNGQFQYFTFNRHTQKLLYIWGSHCTTKLLEAVSYWIKFLYVVPGSEK